MNLLYKNGEPTKYIWIAPERTGTRATNLYFKDIGYVPKIIGGSIPQSSATSYTHNTTIHPPYLNNNYALICNVRNPYKRVLSIWKKIHIFNELKNMDVVNKDKDVNTVTDTIFANFLKTDKQEIKSKLILYRCVCKDFNIFVDDHKTWITIYNKNNNLFSFKESYYIRMENLVEDIFKLPFNNNKQHFIVNKDYTFTNDRIKLIKYHFLRNIISYNDIDILYYKNLIEKYFYKSDNESSFMASFYAKLLALDCIEKKEYVEYVKSFFLTTDKNNLTKLIDLNILFEDRNFYDERTSSIVHYLNKDWFEKFNYSRDSWK